MALMPVQQGSGLGQNGKLAPWQQTFRRQAPQIHETVLGRRCAGKPSLTIFIDSQKYAFSRIRLPERLQPPACGECLVPVHVNMPRSGKFQEAVQPFPVGSAIGAAVERIAEKSERI
jgi:hypothetical protein